MELKKKQKDIVLAAIKLKQLIQWVILVILV